MIKSALLNPAVNLKAWTPSVTQIRWSNRPNLQRPLPLHYRRKRMVEVTLPIYPPPSDECLKTVDPVEEQSDRKFVEKDAYFTYLSKYYRQQFYDHEMICIFHMNSFKMNDFQKVRGILYDNEYHLKIINHRYLYEKIMRHALYDTKFSPVLSLCGLFTSFGFSKNKDIPGLLKLMKKMPMYTLLGIIMEDRLLNKVDIDRIAEIKTIDNARAQFSYTLSQTASTLSQYLESTQNSLVQSLQTYSSATTSTNSTQNEEDKSNSPASTSTPTISNSTEDNKGEISTSEDSKNTTS